MESTVKISCAISTSDTAAPLGMEIWLNDLQIFNQDHITENIKFCYDMLDADAEHELRFVMKNKTAQHTTVDQAGNIIKDACLSIADLAFDEIQLGHVFTELAVYTHDFNGTGNNTQEIFYGTIGCNGTVCLKFTAPVYLWLLENM
jgi:hypothetical protein